MSNLTEIVRKNMEEVGVDEQVIERLINPKNYKIPYQQITIFIETLEHPTFLLLTAKEAIIQGSIEAYELTREEAEKMVEDFISFNTAIFESNIKPNLKIERDENKTTD